MKNFLYPTTLALLSMVLTVQTASASDCGISKRVAYNDSYCLDADIDNNNGNFFTNSRWTLANICTGYNNSLKFKVDLKAHADVEYTVDDGESASGSERAEINQVSCCKDSAPVISNNRNICGIEYKIGWKNKVLHHCTVKKPDDTNCPDDPQDWYDNF